MTTDGSRKPPARIEPLTAAQKELVEQNLSLANKAASMLRRKYPGIELAELVAHGCQGLISAAKNFRADQGIAFAAFAFHRVRGAIIDGVRQSSGYTHALRDRHALEQRLAACRARQGELSETLERLAEIAAKAPKPKMVSLLDAQAVRDTSASPETQLQLVRMREQVQRAAATLETTEREIVNGLFHEGKTLEEVGAKLGISKSWSLRKRDKALEKMGEQIARGADASPRVAPLQGGRSK